MDASEIYGPIYLHFLNYDYKLCNSYIYNWESDFFAVSKSGYQLEVEVKISRGDFFRDFEKEKHRLFADFFNKKTHHIYRNTGYHWDSDNIICNAVIPKITFDYDGRSYNHSYRKYNWPMEMVGNKWMYVVNDYGRAYVRREVKEIRAACTNINIKPLSEILCPNSFYYACPEGMIKANEVPNYAGLIYIVNKNVQIIKKAPYIHKDRKNITRILLQKFYNLWQLNTTLQRKMEMFNTKAL